MTELQPVQLVAGLVAAATPWCVVRTAAIVAAHHARSVRLPFPQPRGIGSLLWLTGLAFLAVALGAALLPAGSLWMAVIDVIGFTGLSVAALPALRAIEAASRPAREAVSAVRTASLRRRHLDEYVAQMWRVGVFVLAAIGLAAFAWRLAVPAPNRRLLVPLAFALFAPVFLWLYEVWLRDVVLGGQASDVEDAEARRRRLARRVFAVEAVLVMGCLALAHATLDLDWRLHGSLAAALVATAACLGVAGCTLALSSRLTSRQYSR